MFTKQYYTKDVTSVMAEETRQAVLALNPDSEIKHFYVANELKNCIQHPSYNVNRSKGFTIVIKKEEGKYSYQVANQSPNDPEPFSRTKGRYFGYLRAKLEGFVEVPDEAFKYLPELYTVDQVYRAIVAYYITKVLNVHSKPKGVVYLPNISGPVPLKSVNQNFVSMFEVLLLQVAPVQNVVVKYSHPKGTEQTYATLAVDPALTESDPVKALEVVEALANLPKELTEAVVTRHPKDVNHKWLARYYALNTLFKQIVKN